MDLVFSISNFLINKISQANKLSVEKILSWASLALDKAEFPLEFLPKFLKRHDKKLRYIDSIVKVKLGIKNFYLPTPWVLSLCDFRENEDA